VPGRSTQSLAVMSEKLHPLLIPAYLFILAKRAARYLRDPPQFKAGETLTVIKPITGTHQWDRGMATGLAQVTVQPGDIVECLGRSDSADLTAVPVTEDLAAFVQRAVKASDQRYVEPRLVVEFRGRDLRQYFAAKGTT
jgi:hypothetical protein